MRWGAFVRCLCEVPDCAKNVHSRTVCLSWKIHHMFWLGIGIKPKVLMWACFTSPRGFSPQTHNVSWWPYVWSTVIGRNRDLSLWNNDETSKSPQKPARAKSFTWKLEVFCAFPLKCGAGNLLRLVEGLGFPSRKAVYHRFFLTNMSNLPVSLAKDNFNFSLKPPRGHTEHVSCDWVAK